MHVISQNISQLCALLIIDGVILFVFAIGEILHRRFKMNAEYARKIIHFGTGMACVTIPLIITNHWLILGSSALFLVFIIYSRSRKIIGALHNINRESYGDIFLPITIYFNYLLYRHYDFEALYLLPLLIVSISDTAAFFGGIVFKKSKKSIYGTILFFVTTMLASLVLFLLIGLQPLSNMLILAFICALAGALVELISLKGWDNITVPFVIGGILVLYTEYF